MVVCHRPPLGPGRRGSANLQVGLGVPQGSNRIGLIVETPDLATWHEALQTDEASEAMKHDGVRPDTILELVES